MIYEYLIHAEFCPVSLGGDFFFFCGALGTSGTGKLQLIYERTEGVLKRYKNYNKVIVVCHGTVMQYFLGIDHLLTVQSHYMIQIKMFYTSIRWIHDKHLLSCCHWKGESK